jgi:hypothetical protein
LSSCMGVIWFVWCSLCGDGRGLGWCWWLTSTVIFLFVTSLVEVTYEDPKPRMLLSSPWIKEKRQSEAVSLILLIGLLATKHHKTRRIRCGWTSID